MQHTVGYVTGDLSSQSVDNQSLILTKHNKLQSEQQKTPTSKNVHMRQ